MSAIKEVQPLLFGIEQRLQKPDVFLSDKKTRVISETEEDLARYHIASLHSAFLPSLPVPYKRLSAVHSK